MKRHISFGDIGSFKDNLYNTRHRLQYVGQDDNDEPIYDESKILPVVKVVGTEKIHGTNAGVCYSEPDGFWVQGRKVVIDSKENPDYDGVSKDNATCALYAYKNKEAWMKIIKALADKYDVDLSDKIITVYYEWAGQGIQSNTAVVGIDKKVSFIFRHFKISPIEAPDKIDSKNNRIAYWEETCGLEDKDCDIYNITNFPSWEFEVDFNSPKAGYDAIVNHVENVLEPDSFVGREFGFTGNVGEGVVCTYLIDGVLNRFKVKGEKHGGKPKIKVRSAVDEAIESKKLEFVEEACKEWRLQQIYNEVFNVLNGGKGDVKRTGEYLKALVADVRKEMSSELDERGLIMKDVTGHISKVGRKYLFAMLDEESGIK